ncbi:MAG: hypothetical protein HYS86_03465 [Candidatus Chisholmbacteria bacterium]|nr:hypothetical protein [Candidatus Chisholmbacteria bacterium]
MMSWWDEKFTLSEVEGNPTSSAIFRQGYGMTGLGFQFFFGVDVRI